MSLRTEVSSALVLEPLVLSRAAAVAAMQARANCVNLILILIFSFNCENLIIIYN